MSGVGSCACLALGFIAGIVIALAITWRSFRKRQLTLAAIPTASETTAQAVKGYVDDIATHLEALSDTNLVGLSVKAAAPVFDAARAAVTSPSSATPLFAYNTFGLHLGRLLYHADRVGTGTSKWCSSTDSTCTGDSATQVGQNLWDYQALNGLYTVREWCDIATQRGNGWVGYYWRDGSDIRPKYAYLRRVKGSDFFIGAGFYVGA